MRKEKLSNENIVPMKSIFNHFQYVYGTVFKDIPVDQRNEDTLLELLRCQDN